MGVAGGGRARRWAWSEMGVVGDGRGRRWAWPEVGVALSYLQCEKTAIKISSSWRIIQEPPKVQFTAQ